MRDRAPLLLRPIHQWFFAWERTISSIYRVLAVVGGCLLTAGLISLLTPIGLLYTSPIALVLWIGLAIAQEHDERVELPVDADFLALLQDRVSPTLAERGFDHFNWYGPCRARQARAESFIYQSSSHPDVIHIYRDPKGKVDVSSDHSWTTVQLTNEATTDAAAILISLS